MEHATSVTQRRQLWNRDKLVGSKAAFNLKNISAICTHLQIAKRTQNLALFDWAIDSKLRACDLVRLRVSDVSCRDRIAVQATACSRRPAHPCGFRSWGRLGQG